MALTTLNIAVFAPLPIARARIAMAVNDGFFSSIRMLYFRSCNKVSIGPPFRNFRLSIADVRRASVCRSNANEPHYRFTDKLKFVRHCQSAIANRQSAISSLVSQRLHWIDFGGTSRRKIVRD